jgi:4Fe-4S ferredoxin
MISRVKDKKMTTRGTTIKQETSRKLTLLRPMITRRYELTVDHETCCGCKLCMLLCPRQAITLSKAELVEGRLAAKPRVDVDPKLCHFCGECVVICPTYALALTVNGQPEIPVLKGEAFPTLVRANRVNLAACQATMDTSYVERCPVGAISVTVERNAGGEVTAVTGVSVDEALCISCTRCMEEGPQGGFTVTKPYKGRAYLNVALCPSGCQACADVCPTKCITYDGQKVNLDARFCLFCGACENVCPAPGAVRIARTGFEHTPVQSSAWMLALEKLVSFREVAREYDIKGQAKRRSAVIKLMRLKEGEESEV